MEYGKGIEAIVPKETAHLLRQHGNHRSTALYLEQPHSEFGLGRIPSECLVAQFEKGLEG